MSTAEAYLLKGDQTNARGYINKTRIIHGRLSALTSESSNGLWKTCLDERNAELMLESDYYHTLLRCNIHKLNAEVVNQLNRGYTQKLDIISDGSSYQCVGPSLESEANGMVFSKYRYLYPVAGVYIDANPSYK